VLLKKEQAVAQINFFFRCCEKFGNSTTNMV